MRLRVFHFVFVFFLAQFSFSQSLEFDFLKSPIEIYDDGMNFLLSKKTNQKQTSKKRKSFLLIRDILFINKNGDESLDTDFENEEIDDEIFDATKLLDSLDGRDDRGIESGDEILSKENEVIPEYDFFDKDGNARRIVYDGEYTEISYEDSYDKNSEKTIRKTILVTSYKTKVKKRIFDEHFRLISVIIFDLSGNARSMKKVSERSFSYKEDSNIPYKSIEEKDKKRIENIFAENGLIASSSEYVIDDFGKRFISKKVSKTYDDKKRVKSEQMTIYYYDDIEKKDKSVKNDKGDKEKTIKKTKKLTEQITEKRIYTFTEVSESPDFLYYEDGELRIKRNYSDKNDYSETTYFDGGFSVLAKYVNGTKIFEAIYFNNIEVRRRDL